MPSDFLQVAVRVLAVRLKCEDEEAKPPSALPDIQGRDDCERPCRATKLTRNVRHNPSECTTVVPNIIIEVDSDLPYRSFI